MYCSICGGALKAEGLIYCNHCGTKLNAAASGVGSEGRPSESFPENLVWAIVTIFIVGLGCTIGLLAVMKKVVGLENNLIIAVVMMSFSLMFLIEGVFIWMLLARRKMPRSFAADEMKTPGESMVKEIYTPPTKTLSEPGIPSVVEHTTRTLDPIYNEQKTK